MKKRNNHISDERLSKYFDEEITASKKAEIGEHLNQCAYCRNRLDRFQQVRAIARQSASPELERDLWVSIESQIDLLGNRELPTIGYKKWAAAILLIILAGGWWLIGQHFNSLRTNAATATSVNQFAFDYGLYLSGLGNPKIMQRFNEGYKRHKVEPLGTSESAPFQAGSTSLLSSLPQGVSLISTYLLESACCQCKQYALEHDGQQITLFQQPQKHTAEFTGFHKKHTKIDSADCSKVEADNHTALTFDSGDSKYVVVGRKNDSMLAKIMHRLTDNYEQQ